MEQNNYKENSVRNKMLKRGQVAIFVIVAVVIVVGGILVYFFVPQVRTAFSGEVTPNTFLKTCVEDSVRENMNLLASQGGYSNPEGSAVYKGRNVKYLCYTSQYFLPCNVQQPLIKQYFARELADLTKMKATECAAELVQEYESRGFEVSGVGEVDVSVEIIPEVVSIYVNAPMTVSKEGATQSYRKFRIDVGSEMYNLLMLATTIVNYEATYGNTETLIFQQFYPDLNVYKETRTDGTKIYTVKDVTTEEEFTFASRGLAWDGGYGVD